MKCKHPLIARVNGDGDMYDICIECDERWEATE